MAIDWTNGYSVTWRLMHVNKETWADAGVLKSPGIFNGSPVRSIHIDRDATSTVPMLETASIEVELPVGSEWEDGWYRLEGLFVQDGATELIPMGTFLAESGDVEVDKGTMAMTIDGYSVLKPASDRAMLLGSYIPKGIDGAKHAASLLSEAVLAPVVVEGSFTLDDYIAYGPDTSYLEAVWDVLDAGGFCMSLSGDGVITIKPKPTASSLVFSTSTMGLLMPKIPRKFDLTAMPNAFRAVSNGTWAEAVNDNPESKVSTVSRGRRVDMVETNPRRINGESLKAYAERRLEEESTVYKEYTYQREYVPGVDPFDMVTATLPSFGFEGSLRILSQSIDCGAGVTVSETAAEIVKEYQAK